MPSTAMEKSTAGVVEGAKLSDAAGASLSDIRRVSNQLAELIQGISSSTGHQAISANSVAQNIHNILTENELIEQGREQVLSLFNELSELADQLKIRYRASASPSLDTGASSHRPASEMMSADSAITVPLVDAPALARLALLAPALQESLGSVVDAMSGGGTITSPVLSQMAGALRLIGANRLAGLADEMGRAVDFAVAAGDAASEHVHIRICRLCAALSAYLDEVAAGGNPDTAPLFSVAAGLCNKNVSEPPDPPSQLPRQAHPHLLAAVQPMAQGARAAQPNHDTAAAVTALNELQLDLMQIEHLLELSFSDAGSHANLADVAGLLIRDMELLAAAGYHDIRNLVAAAHGSILQLMAAGSETRGAPQVPQIVFMLAVLSLMVDWLLHTPDGRTTPFVFDAGVALPRLSLRQAEVSVMPPPAMFRDAPLLPAAADTAVVMQDPPEEIDTELLEIFLQEADELLSKIRQALAALNAAPDEEMHFVVLRRAFHTLKGSGRMVGLERFARLAMVLETHLAIGMRASGTAMLRCCSGLVRNCRIGSRICIGMAIPNAMAVTC